MSPLSSVAALKNILLASWFALNEEVVRRSWHSVTSRLELIVKGIGRYILSTN